MKDCRYATLLALSVLLLIAGCGGGGGESAIASVTVSARAESASAIALSWNLPGGNASNSSFVVERNDAGFTGEIARTSLPSFVVRQLNPETRYCFNVRFFTLIGSGTSNTVCATTLADNSPPTVPSGLAATAVSPAEVDLSWDFASDDHRVEGYNVFRDGVFLTSTERIALDRAAAVPGATHCYSVSAYDPSGHESARSAEVCVTLAADTQDPSIPMDLSGVFSTVDGQSIIALSWTASSDDGRIETYRIFRNGTIFTESPVAAYDDFDLEPDTGYCYTVSALDAAGKESAQSEPACARESWSSTTLAPFGLWVDMDLDGNDIPHIAFKYPRAGSNATQYVLDYLSVEPGQAPVVETLDAGLETFWISDSSFVAVTVDSMNVTHVAHKINKSPFPEAIEHLQLASSSTQVYTIQQTDEAMKTISLDADSVGVLHTCYGLGGPLVYANNSSGVWLPLDADTLAVGAAGSNCDIAVGPDDSIHISFTEAISHDLMYLSNRSGAWVVERLDANSSVVNADYETSIAVDADGNAHIAYFNDYAEYDLEYATSASGNWVVSKVDTVGSVGSMPSIAVDGSGFVHVIYLDSTASRLLKYATNVSGAWNAGFLAAAGSRKTAIAVDSLGKVHATFSGREFELIYMTNRE